jgi:hypothetical protein
MYVAAVEALRKKEKKKGVETQEPSRFSEFAGFFFVISPCV